jgi:propionyl-CoA carboxylase alpha chain
MMIQVAAGKPLSRTQESLIPKGHTIEARLYAEDADNDFLPSSGRLIQYYHPMPNDTLRIDAGVREGDAISIYYDPMIAKIIVRGCDRANALSLMDQYLSQFFVEGVDSNLNYLQRLLAEPEIVKGHLTTNLIADKAEKLSSSNVMMNEQFKEQLACIALSLKLAIDPFLSNVSEWQCSFDNDIVALTYLGQNQMQIKKAIFTTSFAWLHQQILFECQINEELIKGKVKVQNGQFYFTIGGYQFCVFIERRSVFDLLKHLPKIKNDDNVYLVRSPMPGVLLSLSIAVGDIVKRGQTIAVIEAMKMENTLKASTDGTIAEINAIPGESLIKSQIIARLT